MAQLIPRPQYLQAIEPFIDKPVVKVLTGLRRVGKSSLLQLINDVQLAHVTAEKKLYFNFESPQFLAVTTPEELANILLPAVNAVSGPSYLFLDEVQLVPGWERVVNALRTSHPQLDIYLTGSNSTLLSGQLATLLAGRYVQFEILPFSFPEAMAAQDSLTITSENYVDKQEAFQNYLQLGGMPFLPHLKYAPQPSQQYLQDVFNTVIVKDVLTHHNLRDVDLFTRILKFAVENVGGQFSANSIVRYLKSEGRRVTVDTVLSYLQFCVEAFVLYRVPRFDVTGKKLLSIDEKYYLCDHGFRTALGFSNTANIERVLENLVFLELRRRGFAATVGRVGTAEVDFIASSPAGAGERAYYQVSYLLASEDTREREFGVYRNIPDNYPKYVLSMDTVDFSQGGVRHLNIMDFLMGA